ncbi:MAG: DUF488 domain-containing protein [Gemmatimonadota bacterium]
MLSLATIGYQGATLDGFRRALKEARIELLIDIRAVASSRRPGFSKSKLSAGLADAGIDYLHLRTLGTPADGRAAARAGRHPEMRTIFLAHMATADAKSALEDVAELVRSGRRICLLCFEADPAHCHRSIVASLLGELLPLRITHLMPEADPLF